MEEWNYILNVPATLHNYSKDLWNIQIADTREDIGYFIGYM